MMDPRTQIRVERPHRKKRKNISDQMHTTTNIYAQGELHGSTRVKTLTGKPAEQGSFGDYRSRSRAYVAIVE